MAKPIFVIGKQRSGTTWLGNMLSEHPDLAGIRHDSYFGIRESMFFSHIYDRYGDLHEETNFIEFVQVMTMVDYFRLVGATEEVFFSLKARKYEDIFRSLMDRYAEERGCEFWIEKTPMHALWINKLAQFYPDAKFVAIKRNPDAVVASGLSRRSSVNMRRRVSISKIVMEWTFYNKVIDDFARRFPGRIISTTYEELTSETESVLVRICIFLGIPYDPIMCNQSFVPNTSFTEGQDRSKALTSREKKLVRQVEFSTKFLPLFTLTWLDLIRRKIKRQPSLPESSFKMLQLSTEDEQEVSLAPMNPR